MLLLDEKKKGRPVSQAAFVELEFFDVLMTTMARSNNRHNVRSAATTMKTCEGPS